MSTEQDHVIKCSFCSKSQKQVKKLVAGPGVYICDECIVLCNDIVEEDAQAAAEGAAAVPAEPEPEPRETELLRKLPNLAGLTSRANEMLSANIHELRELGVTWEQIAAAVDLRTEDAEARFGSLDAEI